jgi:hypothetical protein
MRKRTITKARCCCEFDFQQTGSVLQGTVSCSVGEFRTHLEVDSPESEEDIADVIRLAKRSCFAEKLVTTALPLRSTFA